jgi:hypothetical protein
VDTLTKDQDQLSTFFDFPAEHRVHLRTTNPIESTFSAVKARTRKAKGAGSRNAGLAMAFKLLLGGEKRWRTIDAPQLVALARSRCPVPKWTGRDAAVGHSAGAAVHTHSIDTCRQSGSRPQRSTIPPVLVLPICLALR